jgi:hypothetical protein
MPQLTMEVSHALGQEQALERLKEKFSMAKDAYRAHLSEFREQWNQSTLDFGFRAAGMNVSGTLAVEAAAVRLHAELPWAAMMFKGMIEKQVREELGKLLT